MYDISQAVGLPGQLESPEVMEQLENCLKIIKSSNKFSGTFSRNIKTCKIFKKMGFNFIAYVADSYALNSYYSEAVNDFSIK